MMDFKIKLKEYQEIVNKELEKYIKDKNCYEKILNESVEYSLMAGGKRLRPILVLDTYKFIRRSKDCVYFKTNMKMQFHML